MGRSGRRGRERDGYDGASSRRGGAPTDEDERRSEGEERRRSRDKVERKPSFRRMDTSTSDGGGGMRTGKPLQSDQHTGMASVLHWT